MVEVLEGNKLEEKKNQKFSFSPNKCDLPSGNPPGGMK